MNWLYYLAEANLYLGVFYLAYCLFLKKSTHYQLNRGYLLLSCVVSFILPILQVSTLRAPVENTPTFTTVTYSTPVVSVTTPVQAILPVGHTNMPVVSPTVPVAVTTIPSFTLQDGLWYVYSIGAGILLLILVIKLFSLYKLMRNAQCTRVDKYKIVYLNGTDVAFSFFNYLFIGTDANGANIIITHELVHIRQKHSADVIFLELLKIINWFNPFIYLLQNSLKTIHEYIADEQTAALETDALTYSSFLVNNAYGAGASSITHSFFNYNLLKKRIIMLNQQRSGNLARLKYLIALPLFAVLLCVSTLAISKTYGWVDLSPAKTLAVKHKLLKVTQGGVTTITYQFSVGQKGKQIVYSANTITQNDKSSLLKDHKIKVDVIDDTLRHETDGRLILPIVNADGYHLLDHYLHKNVYYRTEKGDKGGLVEVGFTLDKDRRITDAKIVKSGGSKLDALALNGFKSYKGVVNDDPGKKLKIGVYFFTDDYSIFKTDSLGNDPEFGGEVIIPNYDYAYKKTSKGYEYDENGGATFGNNEVIIYEKNGESIHFSKLKSTPAGVKLLKEKYGYAFPSSSADVIQFMHPVNVNNKRLTYIFEAQSYLETPYANQFCSQITDNIQYPEEAKKGRTGGVVVLNFSLDNKGMINDISVARKAGLGFDEAAVNVLQTYKDPINDKAGKHSIAIIFCVVENNYRPVVSEKINKRGYVGELAVTDIKPQFSSLKMKFLPPGTILKQGGTGMNLKPKDSIFHIYAPKHFVGNIMEGKGAKMNKPYFTEDLLVRPQLVYIHVDSPGIRNVVPNQPIFYGDNSVYLIKGKLYTHDELEKRSAAISGKKDIKTLFSAEYTVYHKPNNQQDINKYGAIAKDGIEEFVNVRNSRL